MGQTQKAGLMSILLKKKIDVSDLIPCFDERSLNFIDLLPLLRRNADQFTEPEYKELMDTGFNRDRGRRLEFGGRTPGNGDVDFASTFESCSAGGALNLKRKSEEENVKVLMVDKKKCTGCHQCELWCGTEIASVSKELSKAIHEDPRPAPRVYVEGKAFALQCRHCETLPVWRPVPMERCAGTRRRGWSMSMSRPASPAGCASWPVRSGSSTPPLP